VSRGGPPRPLAGFIPLSPADVLAEAHRLHGAPPPYDPSSSAPPPAREPGCDDGDDQDAQAPGEAGHHDAGNDPGQHADGAGAEPAEAAPAPAAAEGPEPHRCKSCDALIYWVQLVDEHGARQRRDDGKGWKAMPVDAQPDPIKGNVYCYRPRGARTLYGRVLRQGDPVPPGARLRTSHFATCKFAAQHRRKRR
jgi:hypothetical protein